MIRYDGLPLTAGSIRLSNLVGRVRYSETQVVGADGVTREVLLR